MMTSEAELLLERWMVAADGLALLFAHEPDEKVDASLARMHHNLRAKFCALFPSADPAILSAGIDSIVVEIQKRRRELEAAGATPRVMN
jgi:hypothetical protein